MVRLEEIAGDIKATRLLYSEDSYPRRFSAKVLRLVEDKKRNPYIVLDETVFHPKSGGQPSDKDMVFSPNLKFQVKKTMLFNDVVIHWGRVLEGLEPSREAFKLYYNVGG